jgi:hypothetical protein
VSHTVIALAVALGGSLFLAAPRRARLAAIAAALVSAALLLMSLGVLHVAVRYLDVGLAVALAVAGVVLVLRVDQKVRVIVATIVATVGVTFALEALL